MTDPEKNKAGKNRMAPRVVQICPGRFHHFDLARELNALGLLERFYSGYPLSKMRESRLPDNRLSSFPWILTPHMGLIQWGKLPRSVYNEIYWWGTDTLDRHVARDMPEADILFALSGSGLHAGRAMKQRGGHYVCDRGSSHIRYQNEILTEEYARWGGKFIGVDPRVIAKEEAEYEAADLITVPSEFALKSFIDLGVPLEKMRKVPYGVDLSQFGKIADPDPERFDILFVGQVGFRKGVPDLLEAFARLRHPKKHLRFVGGLQPEMREFLEKHPQPDNVEFVGHMPRPQLKEVMSRSHVMVLPSLEEGLALVQAQTMACGCPVIATWNTGATDLFTDGIEGFVVPLRDPVAISERLQLLADDPALRNKMSEAALAGVSASGGWERYGAKMAAVLENLATS